MHFLVCSIYLLVECAETELPVKAQCGIYTDTYMSYVLMILKKFVVTGFLEGDHIL